MTVETQALTNGDDQSPQQHAEPQPQQQQRKRDKQKRKKERRKQSRQQRRQQQGGQHEKQQEGSGSDGEDIEVEYVFEDPPELTDVKFRHFRKIFQAFRPVSEDSAAASASVSQAKLSGSDTNGAPDTLSSANSLSSNLALLKARAAGMMQQDQDDDEDEIAAAAKREEEDVQKMSKRKLKKLTRMSVAELKQSVDRPEVVEMHDVCSKDPKLLCLLKAYRNAVAVPRHWCAKRKYLQGKRGIEKPPFQLPDFIKATGIMEMRETGQEKDDAKTMKQKMRERVRPKVGKIDIDYQKLHDAFFKYQVKPHLTTHGDLYYEGREFETRLRAKKPGALSDELRTALGMPVGPGSDRYPPPWLIAMQRYGPPPAFPRLRIPGLNAPIPEGCSFGYHAGGWGKPPVDAHGRPVYGDVFGYATQQQLAAPAETPSQPTPDMIELRKQRTAAAVEAAMEGDGEEPLAYRVLPEMQTNVGDAFMGSSKVYAVGGAASGPGVASSGAGGAASTGSRKRPPPRAGQQEPAPQASVSAAKKYQKDYKF
uniref:PSP domain-containing protein n=1 Tax=Macrostomum lignano TaxID=282301 RepID=A0A1I8FTL6_9PLAT